MALLNRHRLLLDLLLEVPRVPTKTELMKWLFLIREETCLKSDPSFYSFVPHRYGPFSFTVYRDIEDLTRHGYLAGDGRTLRPRLRSEAVAAAQTLSNDSQCAVRDVLARYGNLPSRQLVDSVYENYPWFASRSALPADRGAVPEAKPAAYTSGYEGESIDLFFQKLIRSGIIRIVDVRSNPVSRKYGFSKTTLSRLSMKLGLAYLHLPALGIPSSMRRSLNNFEDYQALMSEYEDVILPRVPQSVTQAADLLGERASVLVCFEADWRCCHRGRLAAAIAERTGLEVVHL
jgi:uncharacterized protein (DUF488 family)